MNLPPGNMSTSQMIGRALQHHQAGRLREAEVFYKQALQRDPNNAEALQLLGVLAAQVGHLPQALELLDYATKAAPRVAGIHCNRANVLWQLGRREEAMEAYRQALSLNAGDAETHANLGNALRELGRREEAIASYRQAIRLKPEMAEAHSYLGNALRDAGKLDEAIASYEQSVQLKPESGDLLSNYAVALSEIGRKQEAVELLRRAVQIDPASAEAWMNLSDVLRDVGALTESVSAAQSAVKLQPKLAEARVNLANALMQQGRVEEAIDEYIAAVSERADFHDAGSNLLFALHNRMVDVQWLADQHRFWADRFTAPLVAKRRGHENDRDPNRRLRIGYVSNDFRGHAVGRLFLPALEAHDRSAMQVFCYSQTSKPDEMTAKIRAAADEWREILGASDDDLAELIRRDGIDLLIDLGGHTAGNRLLAFARKPAPVQATWLGYADTTGVDAIDYRIVDNVTDPPGLSDQLNVEKLVRLDGCFICLPAPDEPIGAAGGDGFVFGCFNNFAKASPQVMQLWGKILREVLASKLVLKARGLAYAGTADYVRQMLQASGVPLDRVELRSHVELADHLRMYNEIDVALDTFPYSGTATTCDALSMGVPVVTLAGPTHVSRVSASLLTAAGAGEWIATDEEAYVRLAVEAALRGKRSAEARLALRAQVKQSSLCDAVAFARKLENAYRQMWTQWCRQGA